MSEKEQLIEHGLDGISPPERETSPSGVTEQESIAKWKKYSSLVVLCLVNATSTLMIHYIRTSGDGPLFLATTAVLFQEIFKVSICLVILLLQEKSPSAFTKLLIERIVKQPLDCLKVSVPAFVYIVQNNLVFVALTNLDAATFQVLYQLRIITTALFSVVMLGRHLSYVQWFSLATLFAGISIVQLQLTGGGAASDSSTHEHNSPAHKRSAAFIGLLAVVSSATLSGFAGVYFERILKGSAPSVWLRNVQLGVIGTAIALATVFAKDGERVATAGFLVGYTPLVWLTIVVQSLSGLSVAAVIRYADNILKTFATAMAIVISCLVSYFLFDFRVTLAFLCGASIVVLSGFAYSKFVYIAPSP